MKRLLKYELFLVLILLIISLIYMYLPELEVIELFIKQNQNISMILFVIFYVILGLLGISLISLTILGGLIFDFFPALILSFISVTIATTLAYAISKLIKSHLESVGFKLHFKTLEKAVLKIRDKLKNQTFVKITILRIVFPAIQFSYAAGLVKEISLKEFMIVSILINFITTFNILFFGVGILKNPYFIIIIVAVLILMYLFRKQIHKYID